MTTIIERTLTCGACGAKFPAMRVGSTNTFGACDLDTRPPPMMRSTIVYQIQACSVCGYCAPDIEEAPEGIGELLRSPEYRNRRYDRAYPHEANAFRCWSLIARGLGYHDQAAWAAISAAWICDDHRESEGASRCRVMAVELIDEAAARGQPIAEGAGVPEAIKADLLRRAGRFQEALSSVLAGLGKEPAALVRNILRFQEQLIGAFDTGCHTVEDVLEPPAEPEPRA